MMRQLLALMFGFSGLPIFIRETICRRRATIIVYHDPAPKAFEAHLAYLIDRFNIIPLQQLVEAIEEQDWKKMPPKSLCITFDDGHRGDYTLLDIIERYKVPVTIYVCAGVVDTQRHYWFVDLADQAQELRSLSNQVRLRRMASVGGYRPEKEFAMAQALSKTEMLEMKGQGVDFQSHTLSHPVLTACSDEECWLEIAGSKRVLENYWTAALAAALREAHDLGLGDYLSASERAYRYLLTKQRPDGGFDFSRRNYGFLGDRRSYPRYLAMILYHLLYCAWAELHKMPTVAQFLGQQPSPL